jgi:hypothetical protein
MKTKKYLMKVSSVFIILLISFLVSCEYGDEYCAICEDVNGIEADSRICRESEDALEREMVVR